MSGLNAVITAVSGLALLPVLSNFLIPPTPADLITTVRVVLGISETDTDQGISGNIPGVALWDVKGRSIGTTFGSSNIVKEGGFVDIEVVASTDVGNIPAEYISITNGGNDAICIAGITATFPGGGQAVWSADVAFVCNHTGAFVFESRNVITETTPDGLAQHPHCVWIDRDGTGGIPHQGIGIHLPDFGSLTTSAQLTVYNEGDHESMCQSGPRFRMYEKLQAEIPILTFQPPLDYTDAGLDKDPSKVINNPGVFADQDFSALKVACTENFKQAECTRLPQTPTIVPIIDKRARQTDTPFRRTHPRHNSVLRHNAMPPHTNQSVWDQSNLNSDPIANHTASGTSTSFKSLPTGITNRHRNANSNTTAHPFRGHLVISSQSHNSARALCAHPRSFGPSFASTYEGWFCDMIQKRLYPICESQKNGSSNDQPQQGTTQTPCCFNTQQISLQGCPITETAPNDMEMIMNDNVQASSAAPKMEAGTYTSVQYW